MTQRSPKNILVTGASSGIGRATAETLGAAGVATGDPGLADSVLGKPEAFMAVGMHFKGLVALSQGFMLTCLVWSAASALLIDREFRQAAMWMCAGAVLSFFGFIHAGHITGAGAVYDIRPGSGTSWAIGYAMCAAFFALVSTMKSATDDQPTNQRTYIHTCTHTYTESVCVSTVW